MTDLKVTKRKGAYVIQDYGNNRKQVKDKHHKTLTFTNRRTAEAYAKELSGAVERKEIKLTDRHKFLDKFKEHAEFRIEMANQPGARDSVSGVSGYLNYYHKYIVPYFPKDKEGGDIYLDQIDGPVLEAFVLALKKVGVPHKTNKNIIQHIHTFLRWCLYKSYHHEFGSALNWKIGKHGSSYLLPENDDELYEKETEVLTNEEANKVLSYVKERRELSRDDAMAYGFFTMLGCFGLRSSEIRGLKKSSFDFDNNTVSIKGAYHARTGYVNKTKNRGSRRTIPFTPRQAEHIKWFADYMEKLRPHNKYFFSGARGDGPIGEYYSRKIVWKTYAALGLAKIRVYTQANTEQYEVLDCRFKGSPTKTWRHYVALNMINNMEVLKLSPNEIKQRVGHTRWTTTIDRYGNHNEASTSEANRIVAEKVDLALGYKY
ncbi:tyrosine-type recombinase/integrase [Candidatus Pelagibacter ubique]|nr:tyrosine-type recombinase/integrase [Candidatus Pelagibacter ubique]